MVRVAFYDATLFSHSYPSEVYGPLAGHWLQGRFELSAANGHNVVVTVRDRRGLQWLWAGTAGDVFDVTSREAWVPLHENFRQAPA